VNLNSTGACVLGLLQMGPAPGQPGFGQGGPMTGGQIFAAARRSVSRFWNLTRSQLYAELPRLERDGLIEAAGPPGPRGAQPYQVTAAGQQRFNEWITAFVNVGPKDEQLRSPLLLAVFFGNFVQPRRLVSLIEEYRARHQRSLAVAQDMLQAIAGDTSLPGAALARRAAYEEMMINWLTEVVTRVPDSPVGEQPANAPAPQSHSA
jgi:DNA-binding PadR family transcriptional regulator